MSYKGSIKKRSYLPLAAATVFMASALGLGTHIVLKARSNVAAGEAQRQQRQQTPLYTLESHVARLEDVDLDGDGKKDAVELDKYWMTVWLNGNPVADYRFSPLEVRAVVEIERELPTGEVVTHNPAEWYSRIAGAVRENAWRTNWPEGFSFKMKPDYRLGEYWLQGNADLDGDGEPDKFSISAERLAVQLSNPKIPTSFFDQSMADRISMTINTPKGKEVIKPQTYWREARKYTDRFANTPNQDLPIGFSWHKTGEPPQTNSLPHETISQLEAD